MCEKNIKFMQASMVNSGNYKIKFYSNKFILNLKVNK